ncbi:DNA mismatch repair endonuclease MutH [Kangiella profundi]|uniref:DNA mismatch repair protein MutH n=1 Tax=Kangiella profundi TaxID=1561924 RepID=A0A2K9A7P8_9GAMM|nr:DNA mismatch repair endonuclease MutH [Kangiella profundi]AUD79835.1 DNA mismatch repair endonuclease MutH [Kangiella profundi]GGE94991.1 DNA mismatch repair protein MutH [Kangiella profundi]
MNQQTYATQQELLEKAQSLSGFTLGELAEKYQSELPSHLLREKGRIGQFFEYLLGATSGSLAQPDFVELGVELKTLPIDSSGRPLESTYVSVVPLKDLQGLHWHNSVVRHKLLKVLWIPILAERTIPIEQRQVAMPFIWQPTAHQEGLLRKDFEDTIETVALGQIEQIDARFGEVMQVRPKAANAKALTEAIGPEGETIQTLPRGFYLRPSFTRGILETNFS